MEPLKHPCPPTRHPIYKTLVPPLVVMVVVVVVVIVVVVIVIILYIYIFFIISEISDDCTSGFSY